MLIGVAYSVGKPFYLQICTCKVIKNALFEAWKALEFRAFPCFSGLYLKPGKPWNFMFFSDLEISG